MATVKDLLEGKGYSVYAVGPDESLRAALSLMAEKKIGALPVIEGEKIVGIFSERDFARHAVEFSECLDLNVPVRNLMSSPVYFANPELTVDECMTVMTEKKLRHLPVIQESKLIGLVSIGDVVKQQIADKQDTINMLEHTLWVNLI